MRKVRTDSKVVLKAEKAKAGTLDGTPEKAEKDGMINTSKKAKEKECRETATTVASPAIHRKEKEKGKASKERAGIAENKATERKIARALQKE